MPLYEYYCEHCNVVYEALRPIREASLPVPCPECSRDGPRIMSSFAAFTYRDGYPRRIPDKGTYWHLGKEVKSLVTGPVRPNEHPAINKPEPEPAKLKGDLAAEREIRRLQSEAKALEEKERQAAVAAYEAK